MAISPEKIVAALEKWRVRFRKHGKNLFLVCPDHKNGQERTPSMLLTLSYAYKRPLGAAHCFACGADYKNWADFFGRITGRDPAALPDHEETDFHDIVDDDLEAFFLGENNLEHVYNQALPWDNKDWRGVSSKMMRRLGARYIIHPKLFRMQAFLPAFCGGELQGGIYANIEKDKRAHTNYINTDGDWAAQTLFGFDTCERLIRKHKLKCVCGVEGPRDTLRYQDYGIPAVGILGTGHAGNAKKYAMLDNLDIEFFVSAFDGDEAGQEATKRARQVLKDEFRFLRHKMKDEKEDPGNMIEKRVLRLRDMIYDL